MNRIDRIEPGELFSQAVAYNKTLYLSGQVALDSAGAEFETQIREVLTRIDTLLVRGKSSRDRILSALVHLTSRDHLQDLNRAWAAWLPQGSAPTRTTVVTPLVMPGLLVEITVIAATNDIDLNAT